MCVARNVPRILCCQLSFAAVVPGASMCKPVGPARQTSWSSSGATIMAIALLHTSKACVTQHTWVAYDCYYYRVQDLPEHFTHRNHQSQADSLVWLGDLPAR